MNSTTNRRVCSDFGDESVAKPRRGSGFLDGDGEATKGGFVDVGMGAFAEEVVGGEVVGGGDEVGLLRRIRQYIRQLRHVFPARGARVQRRRTLSRIPQTTHCCSVFPRRSNLRRRYRRRIALIHRLIPRRYRHRLEGLADGDRIPIYGRRSNVSSHGGHIGLRDDAVAGGRRRRVRDAVFVVLRLRLRLRLVWLSVTHGFEVRECLGVRIGDAKEDEEYIIRRLKK
ncbi:Late embryogenesis abundant protein D-34 [Senna tora]|uniref:Late embryogenesis abundant protein D-34 n=1 Tax=Senna tora TaxID=362788 RepID=A0A834X212_9FABA|nr:Late embryogenesis abundant protein D-34 [Senna tora]